MTPSNKQSLETIVRNYLDAVGRKDMETVHSLLAPDVTFDGPVMSIVGVEEVLNSLRRIGAIHLRNEVRRVFVDRDEVCVIYDFVTEAVGVVPTIEWLRVADGRIQSIRLYYDQLPWQVLRRQLTERASVASA